MPRAERIRRWEALIDNVRGEDVLHWRRSFVKALEAAVATPAASVPALE
jgi:trehalose 6-phosphate synthase